jgi:hypothetical protein
MNTLSNTAHGLMALPRRSRALDILRGTGAAWQLGMEHLLPVLALLALLALEALRLGARGIHRLFVPAW